ncbi:MAG: sigma-70 family RNA polymerase sigma factor [Bacteroidetes bacterium]|nr:sigma-70 family RNA polymerase sigma factor [Bacteroidota bacterium]HET6244103.1 sigma-70 family RNA polymerase sigma factor [Bacteroidia bacterium]
MSQQLNDHELVSQYLSGNENALETLISRHKSKIYSYILQIVKDHQLAEDVFQDTFFKVINTLRKGNYNEEGKFLPWVLRIAHNLVIDHFRKNKRMPVVDGGEDFDIFDILPLKQGNIEDKLIKDQIHEDVRKLIQYLPPDQKEVLMLRHYSDMSFKEIADLTNVSINTALGRMRYALINLRKLIAEKDIILTR